MRRRGAEHEAFDGTSVPDDPGHSADPPPGHLVEPLGPGAPGGAKLRKNKRITNQIGTMAGRRGTKVQKFSFKVAG
jgi:hypothetical protein